MSDWQQGIRVTHIAQDVDVLLPIRPQPLRLPAVIESLKKQSFKNWHLIALLDRDDGSNQLLLSTLLPDSQLTCIPCDYAKDGFPAMLNQGLKVSRAPFIARQDDDDISQPFRFESQVKSLICSDGVVASVGWASVQDQNGRTLHTIRQPSDRREFVRTMMFKNIVPHSSVMFKRQPVVDLGGYDERLRGCEDYDLWIRLLCKGHIVSIDRVVTEILMNPQGMSRQRVPLSSALILARQRVITCKVLGSPRTTALYGGLRWYASELLGPMRKRSVAKVD